MILSRQMIHPDQLWKPILMAWWVLLQHSLLLHQLESKAHQPLLHIPLKFLPAPNHLLLMANPLRWMHTNPIHLNKLDARRLIKENPKSFLISRVLQPLNNNQLLTKNQNERKIFLAWFEENTTILKIVLNMMNLTNFWKVLPNLLY